jgi:hypothetical protein
MIGDPWFMREKPNIMRLFCPLSIDDTGDGK